MKTARTAILVDRYPLYLEALERLLEGGDISAPATTSPTVALRAIASAGPTLW